MLAVVKGGVWTLFAGVGRCGFVGYGVCYAVGGGSWFGVGLEVEVRVVEVVEVVVFG